LTDYPLHGYLVSVEIVQIQMMSLNIPMVDLNRCKIWLSSSTNYERRSFYAPAAFPDSCHLFRR
jgi:hypothetical protein